MLFDRVAAVSVGKSGQMGSRIEKLRISFNVIKSEDSEANDISIAIYNLSQSTRSAFETTGNRVVLEAGYRDQSTVLLAVGDIVRGETSYNHPDVITKVDAKDGGFGLRNARVSVTYEAGTPAKTMVQDLLKKLDIDQVEITADLTGAFRSAWSAYGSVRESLDKLAGRFGFSWSVQNNTAQITNARSPSQRSAVVLTPGTGLIGIPSKLDDTRGDMDKAKESPGLLVQCLLNPAMVPGDPVVIEAKDYPRANYRIRKVTHFGDTHGGDWYSELEAISNA